MQSKVYIDEKTIRKKVAEIGEQITKDYEGKEVIFICILKGSFMFFADLVRYVKLKCQVDFMSVSSYGNATISSGVVRIEKDLKNDIMGKNVIVVEDIIDTGLTLTYIKGILLSRRPASFSICTLLDKKECRKSKIDFDYVGFEIEDKFVVGYGLDYAENYRNLPYIAVLED